MEAVHGLGPNVHVCSWPWLLHTPSAGTHKKIGNHGIWWFHSLLVCEDQVFPVIGAGEWYFKDADYCPARLSPSLQYMTLMHLHRRGCLGLNDASLCCSCLLTVRANNALVRTTGRVTSVIFSACTKLVVGQTLSLAKTQCNKFDKCTPIQSQASSQCCTRRGPASTRAFHCFSSANFDCLT